MTAVPRGWSETGIASWYGHPYHGRRAANGEIYDMEQLTAAHKTLPFDTIVKVTSLTNGKSITVRITDRGPFIDGRVIDLSRAAARQIDMIGPGIMRVRLEAVAQTASRENAAGARFGVQVGVFQDGAGRACSPRTRGALCAGTARGARGIRDAMARSRWGQGLPTGCVGTRRGTAAHTRWRLCRPDRRRCEMMAPMHPAAGA